jgi:hypothetical protein
MDREACTGTLAFSRAMGIVFLPSEARPGRGLGDPDLGLTGDFPSPI